MSTLGSAGSEASICIFIYLSIYISIYCIYFYIYIVFSTLFSLNIHFRCLNIYIDVAPWAPYSSNNLNLQIFVTIHYFFVQLKSSHTAN